MNDIIKSFPTIKPILEESEPKELDVRLDKWLWAARFYKTRTLARQAIEGGKVHYNGQRVKPNKSVEVDAQVVIQQGPYTKQIVVRGLSKQRRSSPEAADLYEETQESRVSRENLSQERYYLYQGVQDEGRPENKHDRRRARFLRRGFRQKGSNEYESEFVEEPDWDSQESL